MIGEPAETKAADLQFQQIFSANPLPVAPCDRGVTRHVPFAELQHLIAGSRPLLRPNRTRPIEYQNLADELKAWEAASDETWDSIDE